MSKHILQSTEGLKHKGFKNKPSDCGYSRYRDEAEGDHCHMRGIMQ